MLHFTPNPMGRCCAPTAILLYL
ncbi:MAG: hypothetical protein JWP08_2396, partial [Bryobacterales bacterium]|nr:hypothetical protein [Bryobacterales bacterium]